MFVYGLWVRTCKGKGESCRPPADVGVVRAGAGAPVRGQEKVVGEGGEAVAAESVGDGGNPAGAALDQAVLEGGGVAGGEGGAGGGEGVAAHHQGAVHPQLHASQHRAQGVNTSSCSVNLSLILSVFRSN